MVLCCLSGLWIATPAALQAQSAVEATYTAKGSHATVWDTSSGPAEYAIARPVTLGLNGAKHPIVVLGLGTASVSLQYRNIAEHIASWGYVVIISNKNTVGDGTELVLGVVWMIGANGTPGNMFYDKLATDKIAAVGHSQGAIGALNATINAAGLIKSTVAWALPDTCSFMDTNPPRALPLPDLSQLQTPIFFIRGLRDELATEYGDPNGPTDQGRAVYIENLCPAGQGNLGTANFWFPSVAGPAFKASRRDIGEKLGAQLCDIEIEDESSFIQDALVQLFFGVTDPVVVGLPMFYLEDHCYIIDHQPFRNYAGGYTVAFLRYTLEDDAYAERAFRSTVYGPPEISVNPNWTHWQAKP